jgi:hypothetical protein
MSAHVHEVLRTAWRIDKYNDYQRIRADISAV